MKKLFFSALLLALAAAYAAWPYRAISKFERALNAADKAAIEQRVDFPRLRESLKTALKDATFERLGGKNDPARLVGEMFAGALVDKMVDEFATSNGLVNSLKLRAAAGGGPLELTKPRWTGIAEMTARSGPDTLLVFTFTGASGWKLTGIRNTVP